MFFKKFLNQPNVVGSVLIALMVCSGFVYAFAFDGFSIEAVSGTEVDAWLAEANGGSYSGYTPDPCDCLDGWLYGENDPEDYECPPKLCKSIDDCGGRIATCAANCGGKNDNGMGACVDCEAYEDENGVTINILCENVGNKCGDNPEVCKPADDSEGTILPRPD